MGGTYKWDWGIFLQPVSTGEPANYLDWLLAGLQNTVILALSFFRPALCPQADAILELQSLFGEYVMTYSGGLTSTALAAALCSVRSRPRREAKELQVRLEASLGWEKIAVQTADFYRQVLNT